MRIDGPTGKHSCWEAPGRGTASVLSLDLDATGRRVLMISPEGQPFDPTDPKEGSYLVHSLFTANLNGSRRIEVK